MKKCKSCDVELPFTVKNGIRSYKHKFGYGIDCKCLAKWSLETEEGAAWLKKQTAYKLKKNQKDKAKVEREKTREMKIQLMSTSTYWAKVFQPKFNQVIKIIDEGSGCIVKNHSNGQMQAGHYYSIGSNKSLSLNAHNVFLQSAQSNGFQGGQPIQYLEGLVRVFGEDYASYVVGLKKCPSLNISKIELIEIYARLLEIRLDYIKQEIKFLTPLERIEMRNDVNSELGLYPKEFSIYPHVKHK